jgi:hypothetical protein
VKPSKEKLLYEELAELLITPRRYLHVGDAALQDTVEFEPVLIADNVVHIDFAPETGNTAA